MSADAQSGSYRTSIENHMKAFDKLPAPIREALRNSSVNWAAQPFLTAYRRGVHYSEIIALIEQADAKEAAKLRKKGLAP